MKQINLPLVKMSTGLASAMKRLRKSNRGALLAEGGGEYHLFTAGSIAAARAEGIETLSALTVHPKRKPVIVGGHSTWRSEDKALQYRRAKLPKTRTGDKTADRLVIRPSRSYVLTKIAGKSARVGIRSPNTALIFVSSPAAYYCSRPVRPHSFSSGEVNLGDPCPRLDGYFIVAS